MLWKEISILTLVFLVGNLLQGCETDATIPRSSFRESQSGYDNTWREHRINYSPRENTQRRYSSFSEEDLGWVYRTAYGEARNQSDREIVAICQVIYNRWKSGVFGNSIKDVVLSPGEFSIYNKWQASRALRIQRDELLIGVIRYPEKYNRINELCAPVFLNEDKGKGFTHYYHPNGMKNKCIKRKHHRCSRWRRTTPSWSYSYEQKQRIDQAIFFRKQL